MHTWSVCGKIYVNLVAKVNIVFITSVVTGIQNRLGKKYT